MKDQSNTEVILKDGSTALASDHTHELLASEVTNTIAQIGDEYNLKNQSDVRILSEMIVDYLEVSAGIYIDLKSVFVEFKRQLKFS